MKLLLDACVWGGALEELAEAGHDVLWAGDWPESPSDEDLLGQAHREGRVLVTLDKDFGELAFRSGRAALSGIILFRISAPSSAYVARAAVAALESRTDWAGYFAVVEDHRIRMTPLPARTLPA